MSKRLSDEQYEKTKSYRLKQWLDGTKDVSMMWNTMRRCGFSGKFTGYFLFCSVYFWF